MYQARTKSTKINFLGLETAGWGGGLPHKGVVVETVRALTGKFVFLGFGRKEIGMSREFVPIFRSLV